MIARIWHGKTKIEDYEAYRDFIIKTAIPDYEKTSGFIKLSFLRNIKITKVILHLLPIGKI